MRYYKNNIEIITIPLNPNGYILEIDLTGFIEITVEEYIQYITTIQIQFINSVKGVLI